MLLSEYLYVELWFIGICIVLLSLVLQIILITNHLIRKSEFRKFSIPVLFAGLIVLGFKSFGALGYSEIFSASQDNGTSYYTLSVKKNGRFEFSSPTLFGESEPQKGNCEFKGDSIIFYNPIILGEDKYQLGLVEGSFLNLMGNSTDTLVLRVTSRSNVP